MATSDIKDYLNNIIGTIELPDSFSNPWNFGTIDPETYKAYQLSLYSGNPPDPEFEPPIYQPEFFITATSDISTSSTSYSAIDDLSITLEEGIYDIIFTANVRSGGINTKGEIKLMLDSSDLLDTIREIDIKIAILGLITLDTTETQSTITISTTVSSSNGQIIKPFYKKINGNTIYMFERSLKAIRRE